jgi:hypothetical protein
VLACSPYVVPPPVPRMITFRQGEGLQFQLRQDNARRASTWVPQKPMAVE